MSGKLRCKKHLLFAQKSQTPVLKHHLFTSHYTVTAHHTRICHCCCCDVTRTAVKSKPRRQNAKKVVPHGNTFRQKSCHTELPSSTKRCIWIHSANPDCHWAQAKVWLVNQPRCDRKLPLGNLSIHDGVVSSRHPLEKQTFLSIRPLMTEESS